MNFTYKQIWLINYPVMMGLLMEQLINITDAIFLGHVGKIELGASALAGIYYMAVYMLGFGFSLGVQVMIARRNGERKYTETGPTFLQGLSFLIILAFILFGAVKVLSPYLLRNLISSNEVYDAVIEYLRWRNYGLLFAFPALAFRAFFVGVIRTKILTVSALALVATNIILNYLLIFGAGGFPRLGITGAAIASSASELVSLLIVLLYTLCRIDKKRYGLFFKCDFKLLGHLLQISVWSMLHSFFSVAPWFLFFIAIEHLGENQLAIANIIRSISTLFFVIVHSFATTTGSLVSNLIGAGESDKVMALCRKIMKLSYSVGTPLVVLTFLLSDVILGIYTTNEELIIHAFWPMVVMLLNYFLAVPAYVYMNAVTGTGNTKAGFIFQVITIVFYLIYLYVISSCLHVPLAIYWTTEHFYVILLFVFSLFYMKKAAWQNRKV